MDNREELHNSFFIACTCLCPVLHDKDLWIKSVCASVVCSLLLESLELSVELDVVPLVGLDLVAAHAGEGVDEVVTETWVHVGGEVLPGTGTVLSPVGEVTGEKVARSYSVEYGRWNYRAC